jgi:protein SCO1/2
MNLKTLRPFLWLLAVLAAGGFFLLQSNQEQLSAHEAAAEETGATLAPGGIGGAFTLQTANGKSFSEKDLAGKAHLMFFGFTTCPDVCPTMLADMTSWLEKLGADADRLTPLLITVDPARDTAQVMKTYMQPFDKRIVALTGTEKQLADMAKNYKFYYKKVPMEGGDYMMDHTATVYLFDKQGRFVSTLDFEEKDATAVEKLRLLINR